ncbi:MAG: hypothetical protein U9M98_02515 [Patescibacteria group bacterium]|nr:hypothetical protein [Patescibacteria group bacterium]
MPTLSQSNSQKIFVLIAVSLFSAIIGYSLIKIMESGLLSRQEGWESSIVEEEGKEKQDQASLDSSADSDLQSGWQSYSGTIDISQSAPGGATHVLIGSGGEEIIYLAAGDDKLIVAESLEAEVQGPIRDLEDSNKKLMQVERVVFK